jgi:glycine/D-amino acid oxidase-like deaminating enzyme
MHEYDLVVIGSGPTGQRAAIAAAKLGKHVAVVERHVQVGGGSILRVIRSKMTGRRADVTLLRGEAGRLERLTRTATATEQDLGHFLRMGLISHDDYVRLGGANLTLSWGTAYRGVPARQSMGGTGHRRRHLHVPDFSGTRRQQEIGSHAS